jgi:hypothetical protein
MRKTLVGIFVGCLLVYHINGRPHAEVDCVAAPYSAWSLVRNGSLDLRQFPELGSHVGTSIQQMPDGSWLSIRPIGSALAAVPFVAPYALLRDRPRDAHMLHLGKLTAAVMVAASAVLFFVVCRRLVPEAAWPATILFALGTCMWSVASQALWMHGPATFWLCCALYFITRPVGGQNYLAAGVALGLAALTRPTTAFFAIATAGTLLVRKRFRELLWLVAGGGIPAALLVGLNCATFGHPFLGGYANDNWTESPPLWLGLSGLLVAPSRGLFVYSPALFFALLGIVALSQKGDGSIGQMRGVLIAWLIASLLNLVFYARWHDWRGGWCYGPRFLCETLPTLCLLFGLGYSELRHRWQRGIASGLVALSVMVHLVGTLGYRDYVAWQQRHSLPDQGLCLFELDDTQIEAHARSVVQQVLGKSKRPQ